ncbi:hypothetical protein Pmani_008028 [Petrolisthes manimaculis]|uniref:Uncharacterized protein n=1 Tax=Petrolisthes manimaculis TaxID=1843537 RepID=A0AAE1UE84_9EUCA|nr:hypothetical protein Pmani_008028 [Petrolisthes manimaculis]
MPRRAVNRVKELRNASASRWAKTSMCTARVVRQVNRQPQRFIRFLSYLMMKGPKLSTPVKERGPYLVADDPLVMALDVGESMAMGESMAQVYLLAMGERVFSCCDGDGDGDKGRPFHPQKIHRCL